MKPLAIALCNALLEHQRTVRAREGSGPTVLNRCTIPYGELIRRAGVPVSPIGIGPHLAEVAAWCSRNGWPPINSLAVNHESNMPGDSYDVAPGCSLLGWPDQAAASATFAGYPTHAG